MSILLEQMGRNEEAAELLQKALGIVEKLEESRMEQATTLTNLAMVCFKMDKADEAVAALKKALEIFEKEGEEQMPITARRWPVWERPITG